MRTMNRTFTVAELGKQAAAMAIRVPTTETMEVVDLTTRSVLHVKASDVSMYRHTLHWQGKNFNILNIWDRF